MPTKAKELTEIEFVRAKDIKALLGIGINQAYAILNQLQDEMKSHGYIVLPHKIPKEYLCRRVGVLSEAGVNFESQKENLLCMRQRPNR